MNSYFDHNATTPLCRAARDAWLEAVDVFWHNPSSLYREAGAAKRQLEDAREQMAARVGAEPERVVFTSGATEANNAVMAYGAGEKPGSSVLISAIEHPSVREAAFRYFGNSEIEEIGVNSEGVVELHELHERLGEVAGISLVSVMAANNETGVLQPWREVAEICRAQGIPFHCDAAQWIGKLPSQEFGTHCDFVTGCAHKFGGPKGVGFLLIPDQAIDRFRSFAGGPQESGHRGGTEDLPGILGMMAALEEKSDDVLIASQNGWLADRAEFEAALIESLPEIRIVAPEAERLWNTVMFVLPDHPNLKWLTRLSAAGFAVSTGSACSAGRGNPSRVMEAMGLNYDEMGRVIRVSGGWDTTATDWLGLVEALEAVSEDLDSGRRSAGGILGA